MAAPHASVSDKTPVVEGKAPIVPTATPAEPWHDAEVPAPNGSITADTHNAPSSDAAATVGDSSPPQVPATGVDAVTVPVIEKPPPQRESSRDVQFAGVSHGSPPATTNVAPPPHSLAVFAADPHAFVAPVSDKGTTIESTNGSEFTSDPQSGGQQNPGYSMFGAPPASLQINATAHSAPQGASVNTGQVIEQVAYVIQVAHRGGEEMRLHLSPADLGALQVNVSVHDGVLSARLEAQNPATRQLLADNLSQLKDSLTQQGVAFDRIDVQLAGSQTGYGGTGTAGSSYGRQQEGALPWDQAQRLAQNDSDETGTKNSGARGPVSRVSPTSLDVMV